MTDLPIAIVGAGAAGLAAAAVLRRDRQAAIVLEAGSRIGGRAHTSRPAALGGTAIDEGATWLHQVNRNPLVDLARTSGDVLHAAHQGGRRLLVGGHIATADEEAAYDAADESWRLYAGSMAADAALADRPLSAAGDLWGPADRWLANLEAWEGAIIAAADADTLSLKDWHRNALDEGDLRPDAGVGALLAARLGPLAGPVRCGVAVRGIDWRRPGRIVLSTSHGRLEASACIVTVSTGVLRSGRIAFLPALPDDIASALDGLPMGLLSKLALPVPEAARNAFGVAAGTMVEPRLANRGDPAMLLAVMPDGAPLVTGFFGGRHAWSFAGHEAAALDEARSRIGALLGANAASALGAGGFVSDWGSNPLFLGAYAYARPGHVDARSRLGRPFADGRMVFAGEACRSDGLAGTVGGAMHDGARAARVVMAARSTR
jgi:monoamine oxidase